MIEGLHHSDYNILVLYLLDELSPDEKQTVEDWISESEFNRRSFDSIKKVWEATGDVKPRPVSVDVDSAWVKMQQRMAAAPEPDFDTLPQPDVKQQAHSVKVRRMVTFLAAAAIVTLAAATFILTDWFRKAASPEMYLIETLAEVKKDTLQDGSSIIINEGSRMASFTYEEEGEEERLIELTGEAFFDVASDSTKAFIVKTQLGSVKVHGTRFNVRAFPGVDLEVTVEEGLVSLMKTDDMGHVVDELFLKAGDKGIISAATGNLYQAEEIAPDELYWANRKLIFQETELRQVFAILEIYYNFAFRVENPAILDCALTASFTNQELEIMLEIIAVTFELELNWEDSVYHFNGKGCLDD